MDTTKQDSSTVTSDLLEDINKMLSDHPTIWVFGYGSLLWNPDFQYKSKQIGYIKNYQRRFYQGNVTFRGRPGQPGRVANLVESIGSQTWGVAYEVSGRENVTRTLQTLHNRETTCGGYISTVTTFYPRELDDATFGTQINNTDASNAPCREFTDHENTLSSVHLQHSYSTVHSSGFQRAKSKFSDIAVDESLTNIDVIREETNKGTLKSVDKDNNDANTNTRNIAESNSVCITDISDMPHVYPDDERNSDSMQRTTESFPANHGDSHSLLESLSTKAGLVESIQDCKLPTLCPVQVLLFTATPDNDLYLGPDSITNMARHIVKASGTAGSNVEYVTKIADFVRRFIPEDTDSHLFQLDAKIREEVYRQYVSSSNRLHFGFSDLSREMHGVTQELIAESVRVMAS